MAVKIYGGEDIPLLGEVPGHTASRGGESPWLQPLSGLRVALGFGRWLTSS
jgi:hypothetical protein